MPELPEVEAWRRLAERTVVGRRIERVTVNEDTIVLEDRPRRIARALKGARITAAERRGKHLWLETDRRPWPLFHFGMSGSFRVYDTAAERPSHLKVELVTEEGRRLGYRNLRRLGRVRLRDEPRDEPPISELGFDPVHDLPGPAAFRELLARRKTPIKALLLNQTVFAGVGNWIADEVLYQARIRPDRTAADLRPEQAEALRRSLRTVIRKACEVEADSSRFPRTWLFHVRWGKAHARTRRGEPIRYDTIGGRTTAWVPKVQR
jgi:formamidopyrimidine-DNA glycosylase